MVAVDVASSTDAGIVTVGEAVLADAGREFPADPAGAAPLVDGGVVFAADPAGMATVGVADLAVAGAAPLANAAIVFPADPVGMVTVGVNFLSDVTPVSMGGVPKCESVLVIAGI